jgi:hypothetical protein
VVSFSNDGGDRLSQWRGYTADIAVGFDYRKLQDVCLEFWNPQTREARLRQVNYVEFGATEHSNALIDNFLGHHSYMSIGLEPMEDAYARVLSLFATTIKHVGFQEEAEWRVILFDHRGDLEPKFRIRNGRMIPYVPLRLGDVLTPLIGKVIIGPSAYKDETLVAVRKMLASRNLSKIEACATETPYRGW